MARGRGPGHSERPLWRGRLKSIPLRPHSFPCGISPHTPTRLPHPLQPAGPHRERPRTPNPLAWGVQRRAGPVPASSPLPPCPRKREGPGTGIQGTVLVREAGSAGLTPPTPPPPLGSDLTSPALLTGTTENLEETHKSGAPGLGSRLQWEWLSAVTLGSGSPPSRSPRGLSPCREATPSLLPRPHTPSCSVLHGHLAWGQRPEIPVLWATQGAGSQPGASPPDSPCAHLSPLPSAVRRAPGQRPPCAQSSSLGGPLCPSSCLRAGQAGS